MGSKQSELLKALWSDSRSHGLSKDTTIRGQLYRSYLNAKSFCGLRPQLEFDPNWIDDPVKFIDDILTQLGNPDTDKVHFPTDGSTEYRLHRINKNVGWTMENLIWKSKKN